VNRGRLGDAIDRMEADPEPLDVLPELATARALLGELLNGAADDEARGEAIRQAATVANIAQKEKRLRIRNAISRPDLYRILTEMVRVADQHPGISPETLQDLKDGWKRISI
jgi:hypothetical protein